MSGYLWIFITLICMFLMRWYICWVPPDSKGRYPVPGRWYRLKRLLYLGLMHWSPKKATSYWGLCKTQSQCKGKEYAGLRSPRDLENVQALADHPHAIDSVYFTAFTEEGTSFIITRIARRPGNQCEVWLFMRLDRVGDFQHPAHPTTILRADSDMCWSGGGLTVECKEPYATWAISFNGLLRKGPFRHHDSEDDGETVHVKFTLLWTAITDVFDFDWDLNPGIVADALALEKMSSEFLKVIKKSNEEHCRYEQWGSYAAELTIDGHEEIAMCMKGIRSHSYGIRDWAKFHRYVMFLMHFENGTFVHLNIVSLPNSTNHLIVGYVIQNGYKVGIDWSNAHLFHIADDRIINDNYQISFTAGGKSYEVSATLDSRSSPLVYNGNPSVGDTHECIATFTLGLDCRGWGLVEFYYRN
ncbi:uncharacterized protein LOC134969623 [Pseudophryne corroboree]|uniref:uncharacterized protein LOC134969623 n=1 Tax=Pseudophryne corroboree TaxID=495146 RepID=UPI00308142E7